MTVPGKSGPDRPTPRRSGRSGKKPVLKHPSDPVRSTGPGSEWGIGDAVATYNIDRWGLGYFSINDKGNVTVAPMLEKGATIDVMDVVSRATLLGLRFPLVLRFQDLLRHRVESLNKAFNDAIVENKYRGRYYGVFPIKVNQLREVVEEIVDAGRPMNYGIECGSKAELFAALATQDNHEALIICNGYKDHSFVRAALLGTRIDKKIVLVVEKVEEVKMIVRVARKAGVDPSIGIRVRLASKSSGIWASSGGESAKFGH